LIEHFHAVVWIDHREARVFHFNADDAESAVVHPENPTRHIHHKAHAVGSGNAAENQTFFHSVVEAIGTARAILIGGPANEKHELFKHIQRHAPQLLPRIAAVETLDHPSDRELVAHARQYFRAADRMAPQRS
jgi:hypothetical protein